MKFKKNIVISLLLVIIFMLEAISIPITFAELDHDPNVVQLHQELESFLIDLEDLPVEDFTSQSFARLQFAIERAEDTLAWSMTEENDGHAPLTELQEHYEALEDAYHSLELVDNNGEAGLTEMDIADSESKEHDYLKQPEYEMIQEDESSVELETEHEQVEGIIEDLGTDSEDDMLELEEMERSGEGGHIRDVSNWVEFVEAFSDVDVTTINIISDFETPDNPRAGITGITTGATTNLTGTERFVYLNQSNISRTLVIEGNGHEIDFRAVTLCFLNHTASAASPWHVTLKDLNIFHGNWFGPLTFNDLNAANQRASSIIYHNITNVGNQLIHSPFSNVYFSGETSSIQVSEYTSSFRTWRINATDQTNIFASNLTIMEDAVVELATISAGNLDLGAYVNDNNNFAMKKNSKLIATSNGNAGEAYGTNLLVRRGNVILEEGAEMHLVPQQLRSAVSLRSAGSSLIISEDSSVNIESTGTKANVNGAIHNIIWMAAGSNLTVDRGGKLAINATGMAASPTNIIHVAGNATVNIAKDGILDIRSDSTSPTQNLLFFASAGSMFRFADAKRVNLERTGIITGTGINNGLIFIGGSTGTLDIDVQGVHLWNRSNFAQDPDFSWTPIFNLQLVYNTFIPTIRQVSSISTDIIEDFQANFTTRNVQRVLFEKIPDVQVTIEPLSDRRAQENSHTIRGTANPGSVIRFSGDEAIPVGEITSPDVLEAEAYHTIADDNGDYVFRLPQGQFFTGGNTVRAYAFLNGKYAEVSTLVEESGEVHPVDPLEPEVEVNPENPPTLTEDQGLISIDFASRFDFGVKEISTTPGRYYAKPQQLLDSDGILIDGEVRPNYIQVSDRRPGSERGGWELALTQLTPFVNESGHELRGAQISISNAELITAQDGVRPDLLRSGFTITPNNRLSLVVANAHEGQGTWVYRFGNEANFGTSVVLEVPPSAGNLGVYSTTLNWQLVAAPPN